MFEIKNEANRATLYIYGTIGEDFWSDEESNRAKDISKTLDELNGMPLDIRIDSGGGDVYEGYAIASAIQRYKGETTTYIDGMAASAASYIAVMSDRVVMNDFSTVMIHNAWMRTMGNRDELRRAADQLEGVDETIAGIIDARTALTLDEIREYMNAETWFTAAECLEAGICDEVIETEQKIAASIDRVIAARYHNIPDGITVTDEATPDIPDEKSPVGSNINEENGGAVVLGNHIYIRG